MDLGIEADIYPQNCLYVISDAGEIIARYSKRRCSHTEVTSWYTPGADPVTFEVDNVKFGCALCIEIAFPVLFDEYETMDVDCVLLSSYGCAADWRVIARAHAATNCYWVSVAVTEQQGNGLPSILAGPDGHIIAEGKIGISNLTIAAIDSSNPQFETALRYARPWRKRAKSGEIYAHRRDG